MKLAKNFSAALAALLMSVVTPALADTSFTILGSRGGPFPVPHRSQPANILTVDDSLSLVDVGDGTAGQLAKIGVMTRQIDNVFLSHLHADHFGGLLAIIGLRLQTSARKPLQIYGPPGTRILVDGLLASLAPAIEAGYGTDEEPVRPENLAVAHELRGGDSIDIDGFTVRTTRNTHYSFPPGSSQEQRYESLSYRFDTRDRSIVYTGDTGPSGKVEELARGADLLVGEVIELESVIAAAKASVPSMSETEMEHLRRHLSDHHLVPAELGRLATGSQVPELVVTHIAAGPNEDTEEITVGIQQTYSGKITIGKDLDSY